MLCWGPFSLGFVTLAIELDQLAHFSVKKQRTLKVNKNLNNFREVVKKKQIFYGQADRKGGKESATVSKCENFDPYFSMEYDSMILKTHFISL